MGLETITEHTTKGAAIRELQGYAKALLAGANSATNIALAGATVKKTTIISVLHFTPSAAMADLTSEAAITSDGNLQLDTTDTSGDQLIVETFNKA